MATKRVLVGRIGIETGRVIIGDPCYLTKRDPTEEEFAKNLGLTWDESQNPTYRECDAAGLGTTCRLSELTPEERTEIENRVVGEDGRSYITRKAEEIIENNMKTRHAVQLKQTILANTGFGDGLFPVYQVLQDGEIVGIEIRFGKYTAKK